MATAPEAVKKRGAEARGGRRERDGESPPCPPVKKIVFASRIWPRAAYLIVEGRVAALGGHVGVRLANKQPNAREVGNRGTTKGEPERLETAIDREWENALEDAGRKRESAGETQRYADAGQPLAAVRQRLANPGRALFRAGHVADGTRMPNK